MKLVRITSTFYATDASGTSAPVFEGGKDYPVSPETLRQVALRNGEEIDVPDAPDAPEAAAAPDEPAPADPAPVRTRKPREPKAE